MSCYVPSRHRGEVQVWLHPHSTPTLGGGRWSAPFPGRFTSWKKDLVESSWNVIAHGDAREGKWRGNWRMEWVASTLHTTSEHGVSSITTADVHTSASSSRLNWRPRRFKWSRLFRRKTKSGFCACAITFQTQSTHRTGGWVDFVADLDGSRKSRHHRSLRAETSSPKSSAFLQTIRQQF
jgi:hypothetical protein